LNLVSENDAATVLVDVERTGQGSKARAEMKGGPLVLVTPAGKEGDSEGAWS